MWSFVKRLKGLIYEGLAIKCILYTYSPFYIFPFNKKLIILMKISFILLIQFRKIFQFPCQRKAWFTFCIVNVLKLQLAVILRNSERSPDVHMARRFLASLRMTENNLWTYELINLWTSLLISYKDCKIYTWIKKFFIL